MGLRLGLPSAPGSPLAGSRSALPGRAPGVQARAAARKLLCAGDTLGPGARFCGHTPAGDTDKPACDPVRKAQPQPGKELCPVTQAPEASPPLRERRPRGRALRPEGHRAAPSCLGTQRAHVPDEVFTCVRLYSQISALTGQGLTSMSLRLPAHTCTHTDMYTYGNKALRNNTYLGVGGNAQSFCSVLFPPV